MRPKDGRAKDRVIETQAWHSVFLLYVLDCLVDFDTSIASQTANPVGATYGCSNFARRASAADNRILFTTEQIFSQFDA